MLVFTEAHGCFGKLQYVFMLSCFNWSIMSQAHFKIVLFISNHKQIMIDLLLKNIIAYNLTHTYTYKYI